MGYIPQRCLYGLDPAKVLLWVRSRKGAYMFKIPQSCLYGLDPAKVLEWVISRKGAYMG